MLDLASLAEFKAMWQQDGWCVIPSVIPPHDLLDAQAALTSMFPTAHEMDNGKDESTEAWRTWDATWPEFPFRSRRMNRLVVHESVISLAEYLLGTEDIALYMALASAKYRNQPSGYNQLLHVDYPNHTMVVPRNEPGYQHLEMFIYLCDVTESNGATRLVSRELTNSVPVERHTLSFAEYPEIYERDQSAIGPAGSIVAYSPDVYHRSIDITQPGASRFMIHVGYKPVDTDWISYHSWPIKGFSPDFTNFVQQATPRQLAVLGFPKPGHRYWSKQTLAGVAARYPNLDMDPWGELGP